MKLLNILISAAIILLHIGCKSDDVSPPKSLSQTYYPNADNTWETLNIDSMGWDKDAIQLLYKQLKENGTRGFIVLVNGKIALENYWGNTILNTSAFSANSDWYWASAGKTLTSFMVLKAQEEGFLHLNDQTSTYLGKGWTSCSPEQEDKISIWHQLTMTSGLDDAVANPFNTASENLLYKSDAGTRWSYHNALYTLLDSVLTVATEIDFDEYFNSKLRNKIGMNGYWAWLGDNHVYFSTPKSMARFGHLILNKGKWQQEQLIGESAFAEMTTKSQDINKSYGYLWWLNGQESFMIPNSQMVITGPMFPDAPEDMFAGIGKNGQYVCVAPSKKMVIVRMGENPDNALVPAAFLNDIWKLLNEAIN